MNFFTPKRKKLSDVTGKLALPFEEVKRRASILVVDDDTAAFPVELLRTEGYNVQQWTEIKSLRNLSSGQFDIIVLDIYGICPKGFSQNDGLGVLEHIKSVNPAQIVIAYSGKKFDFQREKFWRTADDYLGKPTDMLLAKERIDDLLRERFTVGNYWNELSKYLRTSNVSDDQIEAMEDALTRSILKQKPLTESNVGNLLTAGKDIISTAWIIIQVIGKLTA